MGSTSPYASTRFRDRADAGRQLASKLEKYRQQEAVILALPRGGVVVGAEISRHLDLPLAALIVRKLGAPFNPELAVGAISEAGDVYLDPETIYYADVTDEQLGEIIRFEKNEIERRIKIYRHGQKLRELKDKTVIITDDGIATGATVFAAVRTVKRFHVKKTAIAVPVCARDTAARLRQAVDDFICLLEPDDLGAIGSFYDTFDQVSDTAVENLLHRI